MKISIELRASIKLLIVVIHEQGKHFPVAKGTVEYGYLMTSI